MAGELTTQQTAQVVRAIGQQGIGEMLRPLIQEIHLFDTFVAGTTHLKDSSVLDEIRDGDRLLLQREDNRFDDNAIVILTQAGKKLGYVPEKDNVIFARLMDAGKKLGGKVQRIEKKGGFTQISIGIFLVDF